MPFVSRVLLDELMQLQRDVREGRLIRYREPVVTAVAGPVEIPAFIDRRHAPVAAEPVFEEPLPPIVERAIADNSLGDSLQAFRNRQEARRLHDMGVDPVMIAVRLEQGDEL